MMMMMTNESDNNDDDDDNNNDSDNYDRTRFVLVLDRSGQMNTNNRWKNLHNALHR